MVFKGNQPKVMQTGYEKESRRISPEILQTDGEKEPEKLTAVLMSSLFLHCNGSLPAAKTGILRKQLCAEKRTVICCKKNKREGFNMTAMITEIFYPLLLSYGMAFLASVVLQGRGDAASVTSLTAVFTILAAGLCYSSGV